MELGEYRLPFAAFYLRQAQEELESMITPESNHTWAYLPGHKPEDWKTYPKNSELAELLDEGLITQNRSRSDTFKLAFIRVATEEPGTEFGGLHVDVDIGVGHKRDPEVPVASKEITRLLFNASYLVPRTLQWADTTRDLLLQRGIEVSGEVYSPLDLPEDVQRHLVDIPPRTADSIFGLKFVSSQVPHQGLTDGSGHFLIAYGAYSDPIAG